MNNNIKTIIIVTVVDFIMAIALLLVLSNCEILDNKIEVGDAVYAVTTTSFGDSIINAIVVQIDRGDNEFVKYSLLRPHVDAVVLVRTYQENTFLTYNQALKFMLNK